VVLHGVHLRGDAAFMSDFLYCDIHEMLTDHLRGDQADPSEIADKVAEVVAALFFVTPLR
jgi:hypothetical protein